MSEEEINVIIDKLNSLDNTTFVYPIDELSKYFKNTIKGADNMEIYQKEASDIQLKLHGQMATITHNDFADKFYAELDKEGINYDLFEEEYQKVTDYYSRNYKENKEESDNEFLRQTISDMKRLIEIARLID